MTTNPRFPNLSAGKQIILLFGLLFIGLCLTSFIGEVGAQIFGGTHSRATLLTVSVTQNLLTFAAPVIVTAWLTQSKPASFMEMDRGVNLRPVIAAIALFALGMPALNQTIWWNEHVNLPYSMQSLQDTLMEMEQAARDTTNTMLAGTSVGILIINVLVVGVLTGTCEEIFFRAGLQRILQERLSGSAAIWIAALVFSVMHFQFFGFVPRLLLGAFFGYLYFACKSLWLNAGMHALNNSMVVVFTWIANRGVDCESIDMFGVTPSGYPFPAILSAIMIAAILIFFSAKLFYPKSVSTLKSK